VQVLLILNLAIKIFVFIYVDGTNFTKLNNSFTNMCPRLNLYFASISHPLLPTIIPTPTVTDAFVTQRDKNLNATRSRLVKSKIEIREQFIAR